MRNYIIILLSILTFSLNANSNPDTTLKTKCRAEINKGKRFATMDDRVKSDLLSGIWTENLDIMSLNSKSYRTFRFKHSGQVDILTVENGKRNMVTKNWRIKVMKEENHLILTNENSSTAELYKLEQTCDGLILTGLSTEAFIILDFAPLHTTKNDRPVPTNDMRIKGSPSYGCINTAVKTSTFA